MSEVISDADKIRNKRLAKLGYHAPTQGPTGPQNSGQSSTASEASLKPPADAAPDPDNTEARNSNAQISAAAVEPNPSPNPFSQLGLKETNGNGNSINIRPQSTPSSTVRAGQPPSEKKKSTAAAVEPLDVWEDKTLGGIFRLTLDKTRRQDSFGHDLHYVGGVRDDLEQGNEPVKLNTGVLDQAILEAASNLGKITPLDYLLACWKRVSRLFRSFKPTKPGDPKQGIIKEARRLCMSYCVFALTMPDMFGLEPPTSSQLASHLLVDQEDDRGVCHEFLTEFISRFADDDSAKVAMADAIQDLSRQLGSKSMDSDYKPYVLALRNLVRYPLIVDLLVQSPSFLPPETTASTIETGTLLGPFFRLSPLQGDVTMNYFSSPKTRDKAYIQNSQSALRLTSRAHQTDLLDVTNHIIRTNKEAREKMLDWFAICVNTNHKRRALQVDPKAVSSDGFMLNVTVCLDQLCEPFMDATFSKIDRIDVEYLRRHPRVDIKEETKLNADQHASDEYYSVELDGQSNFISEVFFLTLAAHHYGSEATHSTFIQLEKDLKYLEKQIESLEADRPKWEARPDQLGLFDGALRKYKERVDKGLALKFAIQGALLDDLNQARSMQFMRYVIIWLLRLVAPGQNIPKQTLKLPLSLEQPQVFKVLPEYFLDVVVGNFKFIMRNMPQVITATQSDELVMLCITFLRSSEYIKNPYLKSGLVTILYHGVWPVYGRSKGVLGDLLIGSPFAIEHVLHALIKAYIEAETTGAHNQFYDKFNIRYEIFQIIKCVWDSTIYRERLAQESKVNVEFFVRFVNLLLNDVTFVLDEALSAFRKIHNLQQELLHATTIEEAQRAEKEELLQQEKGKAKSYMQLTNETVAMLKLFTEALADSFTMPEIVQRLADMLDYNLDVMIGPNASNLKVDNPTEYGFQPRVLLAEIVDIYLNLRGKESFIIAVARDGRSYKPANFEHTTQILQRFKLKSPDELVTWTALGEKFKKAKEIDDQAEEDLGEIPDEFQDPLMFTLMVDPVILPKSKVSIDRSTIRAHLLSDPNDPFNRAPLKIEDVVPDTELKARIEAFKAEKKGKKLAEAGIMDTAPG